MTVAATFRLPNHRRAVGEARRLSTQLLETLGAPGDDVETIALALSEACTNAVEHSSGRVPFTLEITCDSGSVRLTVTSDGPFKPIDSTVEMPEATVLRGRGLPLMRMLMDEFFIGSTTIATTVTMCKHVAFRADTLLLA